MWMVRVGKATFENFATCIRALCLSHAHARLTLTGSFCQRCRCISMQCNDIYFDLSETLSKCTHTQTKGQSESEAHAHRTEEMRKKFISFRQHNC